VTFKVNDLKAGWVVADDTVATLECVEVERDSDGYIDMVARFRVNQMTPAGSPKDVYLKIASMMQGAGEAMGGFSFEPTSEDGCGAAAVIPRDALHVQLVWSTA
jgi:hypothetical protein